MKPLFITTPPNIVREYKAEEPVITVAIWTTQPTEDEIVRNFFKRGIAILDNGLTSIGKKYPYLVSNK